MVFLCNFTNRFDSVITITLSLGLSVYLEHRWIYSCHFGWPVILIEHPVLVICDSPHRRFLLTAIPKRLLPLFLKASFTVNNALLSHKSKGILYTVLPSLVGDYRPRDITYETMRIRYGMAPSEELLESRVNKKNLERRDLLTCRSLIPALSPLLGLAFSIFAR